MVMLGLLGAVLLFIAYVVIFSPSDEELSSRMHPAATIKSSGTVDPKSRPQKGQRAARVREQPPAELEAPQGEAEIGANVGESADLGNM